MVAIEKSNIRGLDIDKTLKGFALTNYIFKNLCQQSTTSAEEIRWYQETAADLTATSPAKVANIARLATPTHLEVDWTRNTSYVKKYMAEVTISEEDVMSADIDVLARQILRLTRAITKQVDTDIWNVLTEDQSATNINSVTSTAAWDAGSGQDPIEDVLEALQNIEENDYDTSGAVLALSPKDKKSLLTWLISTKGASIPQFASGKVVDGEIMTFLGCRVIVSNNVTADYAAVFLPSRACTWKTHTALSSETSRKFGIGYTITALERGIALLTDPKAVSLISNTQA